MTAAKRNQGEVDHLYNRKTKSNYTLSTYSVSIKSRKVTGCSKVNGDEHNLFHLHILWSFQGMSNKISSE